MTHIKKPNTWVDIDPVGNTTLTYALQTDPAPLTVSVPRQSPQDGSLQFVITNSTPDPVEVDSITFILEVGTTDPPSPAITPTTSGILTQVSDTTDWAVTAPGQVITSGPADYVLGPRIGESVTLDPGASVTVEIYRMQTVESPCTTTVTVKEIIQGASPAFTNFTVTTFPDGFYFNGLIATVSQGGALVPAAQIPNDGTSTITLVWNSSITEPTAFTILYSSATGGQQTATPSETGKWTSPPLTSDTVFTVTVTPTTAGGEPLTGIALSTAVSVQNPSLVAADIVVGIGTATPGAKLDVIGGWTCIGAYNTGPSGIVPPANNIGGMAVGWNRSSGAAETNLYNVFDNAGRSFQFSQMSGTVARDLVTINGDGKVGIGTNAPNEKLMIEGNRNQMVKQRQNGAMPDGSTYDVGGITYSDTNLRDSTESSPAAYLKIRSVNTDPAWPVTVRGTQLEFGTANGAAGAGTTAATRMAINPDGDVGIGTTSPQTRLHVEGDSGLQVMRASNPDQTLTLTGGDGNGTASITAFYQLSLNAHGSGTGGHFANNANITFAVVDAVQMIINAQGVGIGTTNPQAPLHVQTVQGSVPYGQICDQYLILDEYQWNSGSSNSFIPSNLSDRGQNQFPSTSILAVGAIAAPVFYSFGFFTCGSDARMKNVEGISDGATDLRTLLDIEITDYRYKDVIGKGSAPHKKLVAQQVEKVFPQAVSRHTDVVPDIYRQAPVADGWVTLATDLKKGERVRLIADKAEGVYEVLEVAGDRFRTDFKPEGDRVFVYGREVDDFRAIDYDAIAMLNVSATQQLKKEKDEEVQALRAANAELRAANDALTKRLEILESTIETALNLTAKATNGSGRTY